MAQKTSLPKGTRDFSPLEMNRRNYIFDTIKKIFVKYGYEPIETPAFENIETLTGKYGEEGDQLLFKILNSRPHQAKDSKKNQMREAFEQTLNKNTISPELTEKALRYDLTVPFARYVVQHRNDIAFPFKRYQIQPVWRADKPQKGRYREFYQCDIDVIGSNSLINEVELLRIIDEVFDKLNLKISILLNNRKILSGIAEIIGEADKIIDITTAIDKIEKIGLEKVNTELLDRGLSETAINKLQPILKLSGDNNRKISELKKILKNSETGMKGILETEQILSFLSSVPLNNKINIDLTLARGLNYYTGAIIEVKSTDVNIGSICGGGRYDDLTGIFGLKDVSGVGVSFGADRIYDVIKQLDKFPAATINNTKLLFVNFGEKEAKYSFALLTKIRNLNINAELYPDTAKLKKQMNYANNKNIPYVALIGEDEMKNNYITLKKMKTGEQEKINFNQLIELIKNNDF